MNKVNLILLIIAMFTGFPAIVAVSQNITVATPSQAYVLPPSSIIVQTQSSSSSIQISSSSAQSSIGSVVVSFSSSFQSSEQKIVQSSAKTPTIIEVKPLSSATKIVQDIVKPKVVTITPKPIVKAVIKSEITPQPQPTPKAEITTSDSSTTQETKTEAKVIVPVPIVASSSSQSVVAIDDLSIQAAKPKTNLTFAEQIVARCEIVGCNSAQLIRVMKCESSGNPVVVGSGLYIGLFQFLPSTFNAYKVKAGLPNGDIYNGSDQIHVASYMFANGQARQWGCK